ncbi:MAG TPA: hypothetical protein VEL28_21065 [Candidatus Binatia bacterium]|nr:hypothetical protein [Candidatus Binatia bacterium]
MPVVSTKKRSKQITVVAPAGDDPGLRVVIRPLTKSEQAKALRLLQPFMRLDFPEASDEQIAELREAASAKEDADLLAKCTKALEGDIAARRHCSAIIDGGSLLSDAAVTAAPDRAMKAFQRVAAMGIKDWRGLKDEAGLPVKCPPSMRARVRLQDDCWEFDWSTTVALETLLYSWVTPGDRRD